MYYGVEDVTFGFPVSQERNAYTIYIEMYDSLFVCAHACVHVCAQLGLKISW